MQVSSCRVRVLTAVEAISGAGARTFKFTNRQLAVTKIYLRCDLERRNVLKFSKKKEVLKVVADF